MSTFVTTTKAHDDTALPSKGRTGTWKNGYASYLGLSPKYENTTMMHIGLGVSLMFNWRMK